MNLVVAADGAWGTGRNGGLLTYLSGDMKYFRKTIRGKIVVMGRKTLEGFPDAKPLENRVNIVLTQDRDYCPEGMVVCYDVNEVLGTLKQYPEEDIFIIGGGMICGGFLPYCKKAYVTRIRGIFQVDAKFVDLDREKDWEQGRMGEIQEYDSPAYKSRIHIGRQQE